MQLTYYKVKNFTKKVGIGACDSWYVDLSALAKSNSANAPYCLANEIVCSDMGRFLRLPLPPSGIIQTLTPPYYWFTCLDFNLSGNAPPPVNAQRCAQELPDLSTGLIVFDILIGNVDRHRGNLAVDFSGSTPQMNVFDHSHALMGYTPGQGEQTLRANMNVPHISNHCLSGHLAESNFFQGWIERVRAIPDFFIQEASQMTTNMGASRSEAQAIYDFLTYRRDHINTLINLNSTNFHSINPWRQL